MEVTSSQSGILLTRGHLRDKWGPCCWGRRDNLVKVARIRSNGLKKRQLARINACAILSHAWKPSAGSHNSAQNIWPLSPSDHKRDPSALDSPINKLKKKIKKKCSVIAAIVGFAHLAKRPHYWLTGWFTVSPVCVSDKAAPVPSQGPHWVQSRPRVMQQVYSLRAGACHSEAINGFLVVLLRRFQRRKIRSWASSEDISWRGVPQTVTPDVKVDNKCFLRGSNSFFQLGRVWVIQLPLGMSLSNTASKLVLHSNAGSF